MLQDTPTVTRILVAEKIEAGGRHFTELFGKFPMKAILLGDRQDLSPIEWKRSIKTVHRHLRDGDYVALEERFEGTHGAVDRGEVTVLDHRLKIGGEIPIDWAPVGGCMEVSKGDSKAADCWRLVRKNNVFDLHKHASILPLTVVEHPFGHLWLYNGEDKAYEQGYPVAISTKPLWHTCRDHSSRDLRILGGIAFWRYMGFQVITTKDT